MSVLRADPGGILGILDELPDPASYPAEVLGVRRVEAGRLVTARYRRMCWAHATEHYRLLVKLCTVAGRVQQDLVNRLVRCGPPERSVHRTWFWLREGEAVAAPPCAVCGRPMDSRAGASAASLGPHARDRQQPDAAMGDAPTRAPEGMRAPLQDLRSQAQAHRRHLQELARCRERCARRRVALQLLQTLRHAGVSLTPEQQACLLDGTDLDRL